MYSNDFDFDLLITCRAVTKKELEIKIPSIDKYGRSFTKVVKTFYLNRDELITFILPKNHWIDDLNWCHLISVAPIYINST